MGLNAYLGDDVVDDDDWPIRKVVKPLQLVSKFTICIVWLECPQWYNESQLPAIGHLIFQNFVCKQMIDEASPPSTMVIPSYAERIAQVMVITTTPVTCQRSRFLIRNPYVDNEATKGNEDDSVFSYSYSTI